LPVAIGKNRVPLPFALRQRGLGYAIERPKSVTIAMLERWAVEGGRNLSGAKVLQEVPAEATPTISVA
jgi:hypothetical protein